MHVKEENVKFPKSITLQKLDLDEIIELFCKAGYRKYYQITILLANYFSSPFLPTGFNPFYLSILVYIHTGVSGSEVLMMY